MFFGCCPLWVAILEPRLLQVMLSLVLSARTPEETTGRHATPPTIAVLDRTWVLGQSSWGVLVSQRVLSTPYLRLWVWFEGIRQLQIPQIRKYEVLGLSGYVSKWIPPRWWLSFGLLQTWVPTKKHAWNPSRGCPKSRVVYGNLRFRAKRLGVSGLFQASR